jgi:glycosyltransferase involved in cell wall biosynthesis
MAMPALKRRPVLSVVVPVLNESANIGPMHEALADTARGATWLDWEFIFVDDGSTDDTFARLKRAHAEDPRVKVVRLSRNYGSHKGAAAGLRYASGDAAVIMAGDLQDHPREILRFLERWREGYHVVWGVRANRDDSPIDVALSRFFAFVIRRIALPTYPKEGTGSFCLIDRRVIDALNSTPERNRLTSGLILHAGFQQITIPYNREQRHSGRSKWSMHQKIRIMLDTVVAFSTTPIRMATVSGMVIALVGFAFAAYLVAYRLIHGPGAIEGWTSVIVLVLVLGGFQLCVVGMLGEYLWRALDDVRQRPMFRVQDLVGNLTGAERPPATLYPPPSVFAEETSGDR